MTILIAGLALFLGAHIFTTLRGLAIGPVPKKSGIRQYWSKSSMAH